MSLSITPRLVIDAAVEAGWEYELIDESKGFYILKNGDKHYYLKGMRSYKSGSVNDFIADDKMLLERLAQRLRIQRPAELLHDPAMPHKSSAFLSTYKTIVVKPTKDSHGNGITTNVTSEAQLASAIARARTYKGDVVLQQQCTGKDLRLLMIGGQLAACAVREPASVIGDGRRTVEELIEAENSSGRRQTGYGSKPTLIDIRAVRLYMGDAMSEVPAPGQKVFVLQTANIGRGGLSIDITDTVDPTIVCDAARLCNEMQVGVCGVDFIADKTGHYLIEINTRPSLGLHEFPHEGEPRKTPQKFLRWLTS